MADGGASVEFADGIPSDGHPVHVRITSEGYSYRLRMTMAEAIIIAKKLLSVAQLRERLKS
jgi:hypothetical protein